MYSRYPHLFIPPDTPAVFVADPTSVDLGEPIGLWLNLDWPLIILRRQIEEAGLQPESVVVIDQIHAGPVMLDEETPITMLAFLAHRRVTL